MGALSHLVTSAGGRVRLPWRLAGFLGATLLVGTAVALVLPSGLTAGATALLVGSLVAGWCLLRLDGRPPRALGFHLSAQAPGEVAKGVGLGTATGLLVVGLMAMGGGLRWVSQPGDLATWMTAGLGALAFFAIPAAAEEALLRGYPLQALGEAWGGAWAVVVTSVIFGALHLGNPGAGVLETVNVGLAGVLLGVVYVKTLSLWWATGVHLGWNWAHGFVADVTVSGLDVVDAPLYEGLTAGPDLVSGGPFGPEGSVVTTVVVAGVAALCWKGPWLRPGPAAAGAGALLNTEMAMEQA